MKVSIAALLIALTGAGLWAQTYPKRPIASVAPDGKVHQRVSLHVGSFKARPHEVAATTAPAPAAGVAQCHVDAAGVFTGYFINTATIPTGYTITGWITLEDDGSSIDFTGTTLTDAMPAGSIVSLPTISSFGDFWYSNGSFFDISIQVQPPKGAATQVDCLNLVGEAYANSDLASAEPLIGGVSQNVNANKDLILVLSGYFTTGTPLVVLSDIYSIYVVPPAAVTLISSTQIYVDMSKVEGFDLTSSDTVFLTVSQGGISDTIEYRYLPGTPGTFNQAPQ